jgi:hypothetical protein
MNTALSSLAGRLRNAETVTAGLFSEVVREACQRLPSVRYTKDFGRIEHLIQSSAWTDATLALLALESPHWQVRHLTYDAGEWHCALSRQRKLPDWLDQPVETRHADISLAILSALVAEKCDDALAVEDSAPNLSRADRTADEPLCCDNFS